MYKDKSIEELHNLSPSQKTKFHLIIINNNVISSSIITLTIISSHSDHCLPMASQTSALLYAVILQYTGHTCIFNIMPSSSCWVSSSSFCSRYLLLQRIVLFCHLPLFITQRHHTYFCQNFLYPYFLPYPFSPFLSSVLYRPLISPYLFVLLLAFLFVS